MTAIATDRPAPSLVPLDEPAIVYVTSLGHALCHVGELAFSGVMLAVMREFELEPQQATALALLGYILMGVGAVPVGIWTDSWGSTRVLMAYFVAMALAGLAVAAATNVWLLFAALTLLGLAASIYHPAGLTMISLGVRNPGRAMGINGVAGSIGVSCGPALGMLAAALGMWRLAYLVIAILAVIGAILMYLECAKARRSDSFCDEIEQRTENGERRTENEMRSSDSPAFPLRSPFSVLRSPFSVPFWVRYGPLMFLMAAMMLGGFNYRCLVTALPTFLSGEQATGQQLARGAMFVFMALIVGCLGQYCGGWLADRIGGRRIYVAFVFALALLAGVLGFIEGSPLAVPVACGLAFFLFAQQPVENAILAECTTVGRRSTSYGTKFALTFGIGAFGAQATGQVWETYGVLGPVFWLVAASAIVMGLMVYGFMRSSSAAARSAELANKLCDGSQAPDPVDMSDVTA